MLALDVQQIQEVLPYGPLESLPGYPETVLGFLHHRSHWIPVLDLNQTQDSSIPPDSSTATFIVCRSPSGYWACLSENLHGFAAPLSHALSELPLSADHAISGLLSHSFRWQDRTVFVLDPNAVHHHLLAPLMKTVSAGFPKSGYPPHGVDRHTATDDFQTDPPPAVPPPAVSQTSLHGHALSLALIRLGGITFGLDMALLGECFEVPEIFPIPCCPSWVMGQANIHGEVITIIDIRTFLQIPITPWTAPLTCLTTRVHDAEIAMAVEGILGSATMPSEKLAPPTTWQSPDGEGFLKGLVLDSSPPLPVIDLDRLLTHQALMVYETA